MLPSRNRTNYAKSGNFEIADARLLGTARHSSSVPLDFAVAKRAAAIGRWSDAEIFLREASGRHVPAIGSESFRSSA